MRHEGKSAVGTRGIGLACIRWNVVLVVTLLWASASPSRGTAKAVAPEPHTANA